ncbi:DUF1802 family protein [Tepidibacillus marianensis]|uniref:DUF1802 family protein n=1 Tax=Tepidibacillus marianensis TaxID=3131995 RepID=UPI0030CF0649
MIQQPILSVALKEWAVTIEALAYGKQTFLMRKGGIHEETKEFQLLEEVFYLFPTYLHQKKELIKPEYQDMLDHTLKNFDSGQNTVDIHFLAKVVEDLTIANEDELKKIELLHIWTNDFAEMKLHWRKQNPIHLLLVRVYQLENPVQVTLRDEYNGCKSWITLEDPIPKTKLHPVMTDSLFEQEVQKLKQMLNS